MNHVNDMGGRKPSFEVHSLDQAAHPFSGHMTAPIPSYQWDEMDYTSPALETHRFAPTSAPIQYNTGTTMTFSPVDYTRQDISYAYSESSGVASVQTSTMYHIGPFRYSELAKIDGDTSSISQESIYSRNTRLHSLTDSERRDSYPNSILSVQDVRRESDSFERFFPMSSMDTEQSGLGACGPEHTQRDLTTTSSVEECTSSPCLVGRQNIAPRPSPNRKPSKEIESPESTNRSGLSSPTTFTFQECTTTENGKGSKQKRLPRSKSAQASIGDNNALEKASKLRARQAHSLVERKYRDNLNLKISQLHQTLQCAHFGPASVSRSPLKDLKSEYFDEESVVSPEMLQEKSSTGSTPTGPKVRKSDVLTEAMDYVNATEHEMKQMSEEILRLQAHVRALEKLVRCEDCNLLKQMVTL